jgi:putative ABC transport system permease protein/lipoprotein-releasing system permease protein
MMAMLINIYLSQRVVEFGLLQAIGIAKTRLVVRALWEAVFVVIGGWSAGVLSAFALLKIVESALMEPRGYYIDPLDPLAYTYSIPVPIAILMATAATVWFRFRAFDPISVLERRIA